MKKLGPALLAALPVALVSSVLAPVAATAATPDPEQVHVSEATPAAEPQARRRNAHPVRHHSWTTYHHFKAGKRSGLRLGRGVVRMGKPRVRRIAGRSWETGIWVSPWASSPFPITSVIPSWEASTPGASMVRVQVRARAADGTVGTWDNIAEWSTTSSPVRRSTHASQRDDLGRVNVDTWVAHRSVSSWQVRVMLLREPGSRLPVVLERVGGVASGTITPPVTTSRPGPNVGTVLPVPTYSQMVHRGHSPEWGGGGQAWCSPTSLAMVLGYYGIRQDLSDDERAHPDGVVDHTARMVYDHGYGGTGNWAFNTAYAATLVDGDSFVARLRDLRQAENYIARGIPLIVSIAFGRGELRGAPISSTNGHLVVVVGFRPNGDVVVNDPAGATNSAVRRVYDRAQFERIWLRASSGTAYVVRNS